MSIDVPYAEELDTCLRCGYCKAECPTWRQVGWESAGPRGKALWLARMARTTPLDRLAGLTVEPNERAFLHFHYCTLCGMCSEVCQTSIPLHRVWEEARERLALAGWGPLPSHATMLASARVYRNPYGQPPARRTEWMGERRSPPTGDVAWFVGCSESYTQFQAAISGMHLLDAAGVRWTTLGTEEWCCGNPHVKFGKTEDLEVHARHNVDALEATGASRVVSGCPGCTLNLRDVYRRRGLGGDYEVLHLTELLARLLDSGDLRVRRQYAGRVIYHDPCELGRVGSRTYAAPRRILDKACGKGEWLEFPENRDRASCCGGGGALKALDDAAAVAIGVRKMKLAVELGADTVVSACPTCRFNFNHAFQSMKRARKSSGKAKGKDEGKDEGEDEGGDEREGKGVGKSEASNGGGRSRLKVRVMDIKELLERCV